MNKRKRVQIDCSKPQLTDQSDLNMSNINTIMANYSKNGLLPHVQEKVARYIDNTQIMPLEEAHAAIQAAKNMFNELPAKIRKLMDNDPTKLVDFIKDPENEDILVKYNVLEKKFKIEKKVESKTSTDPAAPSAPKPAEAVKK